MVDPAHELGKTTGMARAIWSGSLSFGLVNIPVGLYSATQDKTIHFNQFENGTLDRIRYKKVNERTGREVDNAQIVRGFSLDGEVVQLSDDELAAADPERSRNIAILDFVEASEIDPLYYRNGYYLAPQGEGARRAYALLQEAMGHEAKVAVATLVMRNKEYLVTIRPAPRDHVLILQTMYFPDEVRSPREELPNIPAEETFQERELAIANQLIEAMTAPWVVENYRDTHRERVEGLIASKREGREIVLEVPPPAPKVVDLMAALEASVKAAGKGPDSTKATTKAKKPPTRANAARKEATEAPKRATRKRAS